MPETVLAATNLTRRFGKQTAVDNVSLAVPAESVYAFLGPNGAGKSTTIRMLLGLIRAHSGDVSIFGHDLKTDRRAALDPVGSLVESPSLYPPLSGRQNLEVVRRMTGVAKSRIDAVLEAVRMTDAQHKKAGKCSMGMKQRLGVAIALLREPKLLILDEPTNGLDPQGMREMRDLIRELPRKTGASVFVLSHLLGEVELIATHVGVIQKGKQIFDGALSELMARNRERLRVVVDDPLQAAEIARTNNLTPSTSADNPELLMLDADEGVTIDPAAVNSALVSRGIGVKELVLTRASLEDAFLDLTSSDGAPS